LRVAPVLGEALDSWLEAIAYRCGIAWADLNASLCSVLPAGPGYWVRRLTEAQVTAISACTGVDPAAVGRATLAGYPEIADGLDPTTEGVLQSVPGGRMCGSRYCPYCLAASGGRWKLTWRLAWTFACVQHHCLLATVCPVCCRPQRLLGHPAAAIPHPGHCANLTNPASGDNQILCDADLTTAPVMRVDRRHPTVSAQKTINCLLASGTADFGIYRRHPRPTAAVLADIRALGRCFLRDVAPEELGARLPADLVTEYRALLADPQRHQSGRRGKPAHAVTVAVGVTAALNILNRPSIDSAAAAVRALPDSARHRLSVACLERTGRASAVLHAVHLTSLEPDLGARDQLRYRLGTPLPHRPVADAERTAHLARCLPSAFWPEWSIRLGGDECSQHLMRPSLSIAVLLVGADLSIHDATDILGGPLTSTAVVQPLWRLKRFSHWPDIRAALIRLADYLNAHEPVIDYERRRQLDYRALLPAREWRRIYRATSSHPAGGWIARGYLLERLRGTPRIDAAIPDTDTGSSTALNRFPARLTSDLRQALLQYGGDFLAAHGIEDEPVQWHPPTQLLRGLDLPGDSFAAIDVHRLHDLVRHDGMTLRAVAHTVGAPLDVVRLLFEEHPAPPRPRSRPNKPVTAPRPGPAYQRAADALPQELFIDLYEGKRRSLRDIAAMVRVSRATVAQLARDYGITLRPAVGKTIHQIDRDWLHTEYVTKQRSLGELARERGITLSCLSQRAKSYDIPVRGPRWRTADDIVQKTDVPTILVPALIGQGGWERLQRFAAVAHYRSYAEAENQLNICRSTLGLQIRTMQRDLGRPLVIPATNYRPMRLTSFGTRVVTAVRALAEQGGP
jgi:hypothetical protein